MTGLTAVLFDLGRTLATPEDWVGATARALDRIGLDGSRAADVVAAASDAAGGPEGPPAGREALDRWRHVWCSAVVEAMGLSGAAVEPTAAWLRHVVEAETLFRPPYPEVAAEIETLAAAGWRMAVISNNDGRAAAKTAAIGLANRFELILDSMIEDVAKPNPELLRRGARRMGLAPAACAYVGNDHGADVVAAKEAGMFAVWINRAGEPSRHPPADLELRDLAGLAAALGAPAR